MLPADLARRIRDRLTRQDRVIIGMAGPPGTGKSTLAEAVRTELAPATGSVIVGLDGFHLGTAIIAGTPLAGRKGAIDTFDAAGYATLLERIARRDEEVVYAPVFDRSIEDPIAAAVAVPRDVPVVITEGNYLLADGPSWERARAAMDEVWYVTGDDEIRLQRLIARHIAFGKDPDHARAWALGTDEVNARLIETTRHRADLLVPTPPSP